MSTERPRYTVSVDQDLFQQIEDFRFSRRFQTRSEATVELIRLGLAALEQEAAGEKQPEESSVSSERHWVEILVQVLDEAFSQLYLISNLIFYK